MKFLRIVPIIFVFIFLTSCNLDYLNINTSAPSNINISSNEVFNIATQNISLPKFKSLNESELLDLYAIDPKILIDYVANIPSDNISGTEISIFRVKDISNTNEVILGIQRRVEQLLNEFKTTKQNDYDLIKNPYIKTFDNYVIFALCKDISTLDKNLNSIFK